MELRFIAWKILRLDIITISVAQQEKNNNKKTLYCFSYLMENDDEANVYIDLFLNLMKRVEMLAEDQTASISQGGPRTPQ